MIYICLKCGLIFAGDSTTVRCPRCYSNNLKGD